MPVPPLVDCVPGKLLSRITPATPHIRPLKGISHPLCKTDEMPDRCAPDCLQRHRCCGVAGLCQHIVGNEEEDDKNDDPGTGTPATVPCQKTCRHPPCGNRDLLYIQRMHPRRRVIMPRVEGIKGRDHTLPQRKPFTSPHPMPTAKSHQNGNASAFPVGFQDTGGQNACQVPEWSLRKGRFPR